MPRARPEQDPLLDRLAEEQAALRRVATLIAPGVSPDDLFSAVSAEIGRRSKPRLRSPGSNLTAPLKSSSV